MKFAYYPGCSLHSTAKEYDASARAVAEALGIELVEIPDWNCCGASSAHGTDRTLSVALPARNLALAEEMGLDVAVPCAACFNRLAVAREEMIHNPELAARIGPTLPAPFSGSSRVRPFVDIVANKEALDSMRERVQRKLEGYRPACYYGCLLVRPPRALGFDDAEDPHCLDDLMTVLGAEPVQWPYKTECCGASFSLTRVDMVHKMSGDVLRMAKASGANCIVTACPLCMSNLDMRQKEIERTAREEFRLPVFYFTEMVASALGLPGVDGWIKSHFTPAQNLSELQLAGAATSEAAE